MIIVNPTLNDFVNLAAGVDLKEVGSQWEYKLNRFSLMIPPAVADRFQTHAIRAVMLVLAYYWSGINSGGLRPNMLRKDVEEICESLRQWTEQVIDVLTLDRPEAWGTIECPHCHAPCLADPSTTTQIEDHGMCSECQASALLGELSEET